MFIEFQHPIGDGGWDPQEEVGDPWELSPEEQLLRDDFIQAIQKLTPENLKIPERREAYLDGIKANAHFVLRDIRVNKYSVRDAVLVNAWDIPSLIRTILTDPLPEEQVATHYGDPDLAPPEVRAADVINGWQVLNGDQRAAIEELTALPLVGYSGYEPPAELRGTRHILWIGTKTYVAEAQEATYTSRTEEEAIEGDETGIAGTILVETSKEMLPEVRFRLVLLWNEHHEVVLSVLPIGYVQKFKQELSQDRE